jgi:hypothetical protein
MHGKLNCVCSQGDLWLVGTDSSLGGQSPIMQCTSASWIDAELAPSTIVAC